MEQREARLVDNAMIKVTVLTLLLWPTSVSRAVPTILLYLEHSGRAAGIMVKDTVRLRVSGFTWSNGTIDLLQEPAPRGPTENLYVAGTPEDGIAFAMSWGGSVLDLSDNVYNLMMDRADRNDAMGRKAPAKRRATSRRPSADATIHVTEAIFAPTAENPGPYP